jgi:t-SNARE complex subunit (syntaxin)
MLNDHVNQFNRKIASLKGDEILALSAEIHSVREFLRDTASLEDRLKQYRFLSQCSALLIDDIHARLKILGIKSPKETAFKMVALHYRKASVHMVKRQYKIHSIQERTACFNAIMEHARWNDDYLERVLKRVQR